MAKQLVFMDCASCGKRLATTARVCHHCGQSPGKRDIRHDSSESEKSEESEEHMAAEGGGYCSEANDFDYDDFVENEFGKRNDLKRPRGTKTWVWITAWVLIVALLLPFFLTIVR